MASGMDERMGAMDTPGWRRVIRFRCVLVIAICLGFGCDNGDDDPAAGATTMGVDPASQGMPQVGSHPMTPATTTSATPGATDVSTPSAPPAFADPVAAPSTMPAAGAAAPPTTPEPSSDGPMPGAPAQDTGPAADTTPSNDPQAPQPDAAPATPDTSPDSMPGPVPPAGTLDIAPPTPMDCIDDVGPGRLSITGCGDDITFFTSVPDQCMTKACGLIFDVHGLAMDATVQEQGTGLAALGKEENYIVVQPESATSSWDTAGGHDETIIKVFHLAMDVWNVEARRVHFTGFSMGGAMTYRMRCKLADVLASTAPTAISASACPEGTPVVDNLWVQGQHDALVAPTRVEQTLGEVIDAYGLVKDEVVASEPGYEWTRYTNAEGLVFELLHHDYSGLLDGHCFIGGGGFTGCYDDTPIKHGRVVMDFFKAHPRKP